MNADRNQPDRERGELPPSSASRLLDLVDVPEGGIVSRTLAKRTGGTLTLFAFDAGQSLSEHSAPFDAFVQVLSGRLRLRIGGADVEAATGQVVLMPADVPHGLRAEKRSRMVLVMLRDPKREG